MKPVVVVIAISIILLLVALATIKEPPPQQLPEEVFPIRFDSSPIHGRGVFATRDIKEGEVIELVPIVLFDRKGLAENNKIRDYDIRYDDENSAMMLGYGAVYNHSFNNSADWMFLDDKTMIITANRDIKKGEEIFVNYGSNYWETRSGSLSQ